VIWEKINKSQLYPRLKPRLTFAFFTKPKDHSA